MWYPFTLRGASESGPLLLGRAQEAFGESYCIEVLAGSAVLPGASSGVFAGICIAGFCQKN